MQVTNFSMADAHQFHRSGARAVRTIGVVASAMLIMVQVACGGDDDTQPGTPAATAMIDPGQTAIAAIYSTATYEALLPPEIGEIVWASRIDPLTAAPLDGGETFPVTIEVLYATLPVNRLEHGSEVQVDWWYNGTTLDAFGQTAALSDDYPAGWLEFHLSRDAAVEWPDGEYEVAVSLDGVEVQRSSVTLAAVVVDQP